jgi:ketosteroid isomerase-like protein
MHRGHLDPGLATLPLAAERCGAVTSFKLEARAPEAVAPSPQATRDAAIQVIEGYARALNSADVPLLQSCFADDAQIDSLVPGRKVSKADYAEAITRWFRDPNNAGTRIRFSGLEVSLPDEARAVVGGTSTAKMVEGGLKAGASR